MNERLKLRRCEECGKSISKPLYPMSVAQWERRRYCSRRCFGQAYSKRKREWSPRQCVACGGMFQPHHFGAKYCSRECAKDRFLHRRGENHPSWKGGRHLEKSGYVRVLMRSDHPFASMRLQHGYVQEHRLVMAEHLGRPLRKNETIHHKNGKRDDNRIENLELRAHRHGKGAALCCGDCGSRNIVAM